MNDVELYDVQLDPLEIDNLAFDAGNRELLGKTMNAKLNALIDREVREDVGQMLPGNVDGGWLQRTPCTTYEPNDWNGGRVD